MKKKKLHLDYIPVFYIIFVCSFCKNANDDKGRDTRWWKNNKKKKKHLNSWNSDSEKKIGIQLNCQRRPEVGIIIYKITRWM